jgi:hypothetical protein
MCVLSARYRFTLQLINKFAIIVCLRKINVIIITNSQISESSRTHGGGQTDEETQSNIHTPVLCIV